MIVHRNRIVCEEWEPSYRLLCSDFHLGSGNSDHDMIVRDLTTIQRVGGRALINGDVFDAIAPTDKRSDAIVLHPDVRGKKDLAAAIVDLAYDLLYPFRMSIDVMGIGNHEESWIKYYHSDPVRLLIDRLNAAGGSIRHGSFMGYISTRLSIAGTKGRRYADHGLFYFHGAGGDSPVTKGTIDMNRKGRNWDYDCLTFGHKHNTVSTVEAVACLDSRSRYREKRQLNLQTASYYKNYREVDETDPLDYSYAESKAHSPKPLGGTFLILRPEKTEEGWKVRQDYASDLIPAWKPKKKSAA